jgi:hypothetical protein
MSSTRPVLTTIPRPNFYLHETQKDCHAHSLLQRSWCRLFLRKLFLQLRDRFSHLRSPFRRSLDHRFMEPNHGGDVNNGAMDHEWGSEQASLAWSVQKFVASSVEEAVGCANQKVIRETPE